MTDRQRTERDRETERQTERQRERERDREKHRKRVIERDGGQRERWTDGQRDEREIEKESVCVRER